MNEPKDLKTMRLSWRGEATGKGEDGLLLATFNRSALDADGGPNGALSSDLRRAFQEWFTRLCHASGIGTPTGWFEVPPLEDMDGTPH